MAQPHPPHPTTAAEFLNTESEHVHDETVTSFSIQEVRPVSIDLMKEWVSNYLLPKKGKQLYRMKGVLAVDGNDKKFVYQAVHMINIGGFTEAWGDEQRFSKLIFIGKNLDQKELREGFEACISTPENLAARLQTLGLGTLRFAVGDKVSCKVGSDWASGVIVKIGYWAGRSMCPYEVKLDDGTQIYAPHDRDAVIRRDAAGDAVAPVQEAVTTGPPPPPPGAGGWNQYIKK